MLVSGNYRRKTLAIVNVLKETATQLNIYIAGNKDAMDPLQYEAKDSSE